MTTTCIIGYPHLTSTDFRVTNLSQHALTLDDYGASWSHCRRYSLVRLIGLASIWLPENSFLPELPTMAESRMLRMLLSAPSQTSRDVTMPTWFTAVVGLEPWPHRNRIKLVDQMLKPLEQGSPTVALLASTCHAWLEWNQTCPFWTLGV